MASIKQLFLTIANEKDSELEACEHLDNFCKKNGFSAETIDEMRLAFIEAIINAKEHAPKNTADQNADVYCELSLDGDALVIKVRDYGQGFDPTVVEKPDIKKKLKSSHKRGWGLMLMEKLMDGMDISSFPPSGTLITMVKKRLRSEPPESPDVVKEKKRIDRLKYIYGSFIDLSSFLCQSRDLESGLRSMLRILLGTMGVSRGAIYAYDPTLGGFSALVDIKVKAREKASFLAVNPRDMQQLMAQETQELAKALAGVCPDFAAHFGKEEIEIVSLLRTDSEVLGMLMLGPRFKSTQEEPEPFDPELLSTLSRNISSAINTYRLMDQLRMANNELDLRFKEMENIREASVKISSILEIEHLPRATEKIFAEIMKIGKFSLALFEPGENRFKICLTGRELPEILDLWSSPVSRFVIQKKQALFVPNVTSETRFQFPRATNYKTRSFVSIPIVVQDEVLGLVNLTDKADGTDLSDHDYQLAQLLCSQLNVAIRNANLYKLGFTDSLTHLYATNYFRIRMAQEIARFRRVKSQLSLIMLDVDHFQEVVDKHDGAIGDGLLARVSNSIKQILRFNDIPCRFGRERLAIILPDTDAKGAARVGEKIRAGIENTKVVVNGQEVKATVSLGISEFSVQMSLDQMIEVGEKRLADAREKGGNRVSC